MNAHATHSGEQPHADGLDWKIALRFVLIGLSMPVVLLLTAGRLDWWQAWVYIVIMIGVSLLSRYLIYLKNPSLIAERARFTDSEGAKDWDKTLVVLIGVVFPLVVLIVAGLDKRNGWSSDFTPAPQIAAFALFILGAAFATWAMLENPYFSSVVRIQEERGQTVIATGPYHIVRHPSYSGAMLSWLVTPILLGSWWAVLPVVLMMLIYIVRTTLEDRTLHAELPGYADYARRTPYRLIPGVW